VRALERVCVWRALGGCLGHMQDIAPVARARCQSSWRSRRASERTVPCLCCGLRPAVDPAPTIYRDEVATLCSV
jgi:hypothetical protein